nr:hypothetical protein [Tanacetum cinerariifolium]
MNRNPSRVNIKQFCGSELEASVDKLFDEGASGDGQDVDVRPVVVTTDTIMEDVAPLQPRCQRKRKTIVADAGGPSHPPKKLREDYGALGGASTASKSMSQFRACLPGLYSSHHSGANIAEAKVDSIVRSSASAIATVTTVTAAIDVDATDTRAPIVPSLFGVGSSSTGRTDSVPGGFSDVSSSDFLIGGIRTVVDPTLTSKKFTSRDGVQLIDLGLMTAVSIFVNALVRMRAEYNIREKRKLRAAVDEQAELLKANDEELESLKAQLLLKEAEAAEAIRLWAEVFKFESTEQSLRSEAKAAEAIRLRADVFKFESAKQSLRSEVGGFKRSKRCFREREKNELDVKVTDLSASVKVKEHEVHKLEISSAGLQEKVAAYEGFVSQLKKFQDEKLEEVNEKFDKLCADFVDMALHLEEKFYPHLLTTISGRRWLLIYGMELAVAKCLNSTEYLSALGATISKAVEKGMQEGLSDGITHGAEGMEGTSGHDVAATLSTTFVFASTILPISIDDYEVAHTDGQGGASVDDETAAVDGMNLFVTNAELNTSD